MSRTTALALVLLLVASAIPALAQGPTPVEQLREPRGPFDPDIPLPESVLGFYPGADFRLADWPPIHRYLERLDEVSDRIELREIGTSVQGQPLVVALISAPENLARAEEYREISERLARAEGVDEEEAERLAREGKAIVWIDAGLHATEVAHGQQAPELAYVMVAGESAELRRIREDVILVLMPNMNPDGLNIVADWYRQNLGTPYETAPLPVLYHEYVGHDNNRDWYMITQPETRAVSEQLYRVWYPQIIHNLHQSAPFPARIFVPPFADPANPNIPPLVLRGIARVGNAISTRLEAEGKPGAISRMGFTAWWNGGMRTTPYFHNMIGILTETALFRYATPNFYPPDRLPDRFRDGTPTLEPSMDYPMPWPGGWWRLRDPVEYMLTASIATLDVGSRYREDWLLNIWRMGRRAIAEGADGSPSAWLIPPEQHDSSAAAELVNVLRRGGVEVDRAVEQFEADDRSYPAGTWVVSAAQAFRSYVVDLLEPQEYPDRRLYPDGPPAPPYDMAGWTLPFQMGVNVERIESPFDASLEAVTDPVGSEGAVVGSGNTYLVDPRSNAAYRAVNRLLAGGTAVYRAVDGVRAGADELPAGAFVVADEPGLAGRLASIAEEEGVVVRAVDRAPRGDAYRLRRPRVGLYEPWVASMDAGWTRYLLEQYGFEYESLRNADLSKGKLRDRLDVVILPSMGARTLLEGHDPAEMPERYAGGMGERGVESLRAFVDSGGTLVALDRSSDLILDRFPLPVQSALADLEQEEFFCPGSLLRIHVDPTHPVAWGMPREATAFFVRSGAFALPAANDADGGPEASAVQAPDVEVVAGYPEGRLLESGWIHGEEHLRGRAAVVAAGMGAGKVVLIGFRAQFRAQPHETFKLLFNSLLHGRATREALP